MDPLTAANTFATIVQLMGMFKQEHKEANASSDQEFMKWLEYHRHEEVKNLICKTAALHSEVIQFLQQDSGVILSRLDSINATLVGLLSQFEGFKGLTQALVPSAALSDQAVYILRQLVESKARNFIYGELGQGVILQPEGGEPFGYSDPLFISDDIDRLEQCGLITQRECDSASIKRYGITRAGAGYIRMIDQQSGSNSAPLPENPTTL